MNYKNIVFDFGNVLARFDEERVLSKYRPSPEDFPMMKDAVFYNWDAMDKGTIEYEAYMAHAASLLPERLCIRQWKSLPTPGIID